MTRTNQTNTRRRETKDRRRENGARTESQMRRIIGGILGEQGKDRMYEERGAGKKVEGPAGPNGDKIKDDPEGQNEDKEGPGGRDKTKNRPEGKNGGAHPDQDTGGSNSRNSYPLVMPERGKVPDNSTSEQSTGRDRTNSESHTHHGRIAGDDAHHKRHAADLTKTGNGGSKEGTTDNRVTRGKKKAEGIAGGYKRPVAARYHKEGNKTHRQTPNKNHDPEGDEEGEAKAKATHDSGGGIKTHTGGPNNNSTRTADSAETPTEGQRAKDKRTGTLDAGNHNKGEYSGNATATCTKPLRKSTDQRPQTTSSQRHGKETQYAKEDGETHTKETKTLTDSSTTTRTGTPDSAKAPTEEQARDRNKGDGNNTRQDAQHAKATNTKDNTTKGNNDTLENPTGELAKGHAERQDKEHNEKGNETQAGRAKEPPEEDTDDGDSHLWDEHKPDDSIKTPNKDHNEGVDKTKKRAREAQEAREEATRRAAEVEAEIRRREDYVAHTERNIEQAERRQEELARQEEADREQDSGTQQRMDAFALTIELTRLGAKAQREEAEKVTREAAGQGLAVARARAMGQTDGGRVKEQVEEKLHQAERLNREAATMDRAAKDLGERMQGLQGRLNRHDQTRREHRAQAAEHIEGAKQEVVARKQQVTRLKAMQEELKMLVFWNVQPLTTFLSS